MKWFRFYTEALHDVKVQGLPPALFRSWVNVLCIAAENDGVLPSLDAVAFQLRLPARKAEAVLHELTEAYLLDGDGTGKLWPHNWNGRQFVSDDVTGRVKKHRQGVTRNVSPSLQETPPEQRQIQNRDRAEQKQTTETDELSSSSIFRLHEDLCGTVSSLIAQDLMEMEREYPAEWLEPAFQEAARANVRKLVYVKGVLENWRLEGKRAEVHGEADTAEERRQRADAYVEFFNNQRV